MGRDIDNYWNRFDESKGYVELLMRDGYGAQASEINEIQSIFSHRLARLAGTLFKDGDVVSGGSLVVDSATGAVTVEAGRVCVSGAIWDVPAANFSVAPSGSVEVGVVLTTEIISELEDVTLRNPAVGSRGEGEPGAWRRKVTAAWGVESDASGNENAQFAVVYEIVDGALQPKEAPPQIDTFTTALARYDRDSTGTGTYAVSGLVLSQCDDLEDGRQVYSLSEGRARIDGLGIEFNTAQRIIYAAEADLRTIDTEVHTATSASTNGGQRIDVAHTPMKRVTGLRITEETTATIVHGAYLGAADNLPDTSVTSIISVTQGDVTYVQGTDFTRAGDKIDWSLSGNEPAAGSTYGITYQHIVAVDSIDPDLDGFTVAGAVPGSSILVSYEQMLPRYDRLALTSTGGVTWFKGIASEINAKVPAVPTTMLAIATIYQTWRDNRVVTNDGVRVVPFDEIQSINSRIDYLLQEIARQRLESDASTREAGAKVGLFVDPLLDDSMRDQGIAQTAAIIDGDLTLPVTNVAISAFDNDIVVEAALPFTATVAVEQTYRTADMQVNPYLAFDVLPAKVTLSPAVDRWTETKTTWASAVTREFKATIGGGWAVVHHTETSTSTQTVSTSSTAIKYLRQRQITITAEGFGPGEELDKITFDGIEVSAS